MLPSSSYGSPNDSISEQSSTCSPAPFHGDRSRVLAFNSAVCHLTNCSSESKYPLYDLSTLTASVHNLEGSSLSSIASPSPVVSPLDSQRTSSVSCSIPTLNLLVRAGLIPPHLADILTSPAVTKEHTKCITGVRNTTGGFLWSSFISKVAVEAENFKASHRPTRERDNHCSCISCRLCRPHTSVYCRPSTKDERYALSFSVSRGGSGLVP